METVDSLEIEAPAEQLFDILLDYPKMREWYPPYRIDVVGGGPVREGVQLSHELSPPGFPIKSRFTRTIQRIDRPRSIEETYDGGDLVGHGTWEFEQLGPDRTRVSFRCRVRSNRMLMHIGFLFGGESGHNKIYQQILASLRDKVCGSAEAVGAS